MLHLLFVRVVSGFPFRSAAREISQCGSSLCHGQNLVLFGLVCVCVCVSVDVPILVVVVRKWFSYGGITLV